MLLATEAYAAYLTGRQNLIRSTQPAWCGGAHLDVVFSRRFAHKHRVESGHLVHTHMRQSQNVCHLVHGGDWQPTVLSLGQIQQRDHRTPLVPFRVDVQDSFSTL